MVGLTQNVHMRVHASMRENSHDNAQHYSVNMQEQIVTSFSHANMHDYHMHSRLTVV